MQAEDISRILKKFGPSEETDYYFGQYAHAGPGKFAVIKISGKCIEDSLETIAEDLVDLQTLGLTPVVTFGWGKALDERLEDNNVKIPNPSHIDGNRITNPEIMNHVLAVANKFGNALYIAILEKGGKSKIVDYSDKVIIAKSKDDPRYGERNGDIVKINTNPILEAISNGFIPLIPPIGVSVDGHRYHNINNASLATELVKTLDPIKYIMLTSTDGVLDKNGELIPEIVFKEKYKHLFTDGTISAGMFKNVGKVHASLWSRANPEDHSVQIVSPQNLLYELFTHKGAGTFIRNGYPITTNSIAKANTGDIRPVIENSFKQKLKDTYFVDLKNAVVYTERRYKGVAIVLPEPVEGLGPHLDLLAVSNGYNKKGVGTDIIDKILEHQKTDNPTLFWRSKNTRESSNFHFKIADGHQKFKGADGQLYNAFWIGLDLNSAQKAIDYMKHKPANFK